MLRRSLAAVLLALLAALPLVALATPTRQEEAPTPVAFVGPDACEPNDRTAQACILPIDQVSGPFTFMPIGDQDVYAVDLGAELTGQELEVSVRATSGLDLRTTIRRAGVHTPEAILTSPAIVATLPITITGWITLQIENRAAAIPIGESYAIELRRILPPAPVVDAGGTPAVALPDALENNWSPERAAPIAVGVVYDLTFACPDPWPSACPGGDHDYLRVPVKAGSRYQLATFDLGPGVDPVLELFWHEMQLPVAANDDAFGGGFASMVQWIAPANGDLIIRVAPRNGGTVPVVPDAQSGGSVGTTSSSSTGSGGYRFTIALQQGQLARQVLERVANAASVTLPTPSAGSGAAGAVSATPGVALALTADAPTGDAFIENPAGTALREGPSEQATRIETLATETHVTLTGQASGSWVRVIPRDGVVPGWVFGPDLAPLHASAPTPGAAGDTSAPTDIVPSAPGALARTPVVTTPAPLLVERLPLRPEPPAPTSQPRRTFSLQVIVGASAPISVDRTPMAGGATPTPVPIRPLAGVRIQLVTVFGDLLTEAITPADGTVTLRRDLGPQQALRLRIPAAGLDIPLDPSQTTLRIALPQGGQS